MAGIIFVAGIHGVGKSTLCSKVLQDLDLKHLTASQIIKKYREELIAKDGKGVIDVDENQRVLIEGLKKEQEGDATVLLDGHFVLIDKEGNLSKIDSHFFEQISPIGIIVISDDPKNIAKRLGDRDGKDYDISLLEQMQEMELEWGESVASALDTPFIRLDLQNQIDPVSTFSNFLLTYM